MFHSESITFESQGSITEAALTSSYALVKTLANARIIFLSNQTNGDVQVSFDSGTTNHFHIPSGSTLSIDLPNKRDLGATVVVYAKDGTTAATSGSFYVFAVNA